MGKKRFVVSDVHGYYTQLMEALKQAGFDAENEDHIFISCGDLFDRGEENVAVYQFVKALPRKILIKGNHEDILTHVLDRGYITATEVHNGTDVTIEEFLGKDAIDKHGVFDKTAHRDKIKEIKDFIASMTDYCEIGDYILTHGWLPIIFEERYPRVDPNWRTALPMSWRDAHTQEWQQLYQVRAMLDGKTIVCGHRPARLGSMFDDMREPDCSEPFYGDGMIAIDAGTVRSGRVNVLVLEED